MRRLLIIALLLMASAAHAQEPRTLLFTASPDHNAVLANQPVVTGYEARVLIGTATGALAFTQALGKPTPAAPVPPATVGDISIDLSQFAVFNSLTRGVYVAIVNAVGPGGTTPSLPSDPFPRFGTPAQAGKPRIQ